MKTHKDILSTIWIVSIHDLDPRGYLSFDLLQILESIADLVKDYMWVASVVDSIGEPTPSGAILTFTQLIEKARGMEQMIDGTIIGWPPVNFEGASLESISQLRNFPKTPARIAIQAVDSSFFEIISKNQAIIDRIYKTFHDVRNQDPKIYFS